jgi:hypothetical protein
MMDERRVAREALFYEFSLERQVPADHLLRAIERVVDLWRTRQKITAETESPATRSTKEGPRSIKEAVHNDPEQSRAVYDRVRKLCIKLGAAPDDLRRRSPM